MVTLVKGVYLAYACCQAIYYLFIRSNSAYTNSGYLSVTGQIGHLVDLGLVIHSNSIYTNMSYLSVSGI